MKACLLCRSDSIQQIDITSNTNYFICSRCKSVFKDSNDYLSLEDEKERYLQHNNDTEDLNYQSFVSPITNSILKHFEPNTKGLDYGAGTGPVIAKLLREKGFEINLFDPFFHPDRSVLTDSYDFIVCCEVIEHFHNPMEEFKNLKKLLKPEGKLFCMTELLPENQFAKWYYKDDPTHVIFYSKENLEWIRKNIGFSSLTIEGRLIILS